MINLGTDETEVMYWCNDCAEYQPPDEEHNGETKECVKVKLLPAIKELNVSIGRKE